MRTQVKISENSKKLEKKIIEFIYKYKQKIILKVIILSFLENIVY